MDDITKCPPPSNVYNPSPLPTPNESIVILKTKNGNDVVIIVVKKSILTFFTSAHMDFYLQKKVFRKIYAIPMLIFQIGWRKWAWEQSDFPKPKKKKNKGGGGLGVRVRMKGVFTKKSFLFFGQGCSNCFSVFCEFLSAGCVAHQHWTACGPKLAKKH